LLVPVREPLLEDGREIAFEIEPVVPLLEARYSLSDLLVSHNDTFVSSVLTVDVVAHYSGEIAKAVSMLAAPRV
jgi:hypothetical protein